MKDLLLNLKLLSVFFLMPVLTCISCAHHPILVNNSIDPCTSRHWLTQLNHASSEEIQCRVNELAQAQYSDQKQAGCQDVLLAKAFYSLGKAKNAEAYFKRAEKKLDRFAPFFKIARAEIAITEKRFGEGRKLLEALLEANAAVYPKQTFHRMRIMLANVHASTNDYRNIVNSHQQLLKEGIGEESVLLYHLGTALLALGKDAEAEQVLHELLSKHPNSPLLARLDGSVFAEKAHHLPIKAQMARIASLTKDFEHDQIVKEVEKFSGKITSEEEIALKDVMVRSLVTSGKIQQGLKMAQEMANTATAPALWLETHAWALGKNNQLTESAKAWKKVFEVTTDANKKAESCFFEGFLQFEANLYSMSEITWKKCMPVIENTKWHEDALWWMSLSSLLLSHNDKARNSLSTLLDTFPKTRSKPKYLYWQAVAQSKHARHKKEAIAGFRTIANNYPLDYYAFLAREKLNEVPKGTSVARDAFMKRGELATDVPALDAKQLYQLGFDEDARAVLRNIPQKNLAHFGLMQKLGDYHPVWQKGYQLVPKNPIRNNQLEDSPNWRAHYPAPWEKIVKSQAKKHGIDWSVTYAIIHAESGFLPSAVSNKGAIGLMQIQPKVANFVAQKLGKRGPNRNDLKNPAKSIEYGSKLLAFLRAQFGKNFLAAASYNAGRRPIQGWIESFGHLDNLMFIERIPFKDTRKYVKDTLVTQAIYNSLDGLPLKLDFS